MNSRVKSKLGHCSRNMASIQHRTYSIVRKYSHSNMQIRFWRNKSFFSYFNLALTLRHNRYRPHESSLHEILPTAGSMVEVVKCKYCFFKEKCMTVLISAEMEASLPYVARTVNESTFAGTVTSKRATPSSRITLSSRWPTASATITRFPGSVLVLKVEREVERRKTNK